MPSKNLPKDTLVGSVAVPWDYDLDGDLDLFVGTRVKQSEFPKAAPSLILTNDGKGNFTQAPFSKSLERVTDAVAQDFNGDQINELLVVGDWDTPKVFTYENESFLDVTDQYFSENLAGWWNVIKTNDLDGDGDLDIVLGNWGTNNQFKPTIEQPMELFYDDFDNNGYLDPIWCYYINDISYPFALKDELTDQIVSLRKRFVTYDSYAEVTIHDILSEDQINQAPKCITNFMESCWFENKNGKFVRHSLPVEANISSVNAIAVNDFDQDGNQDLFLAGNVPFNRVRIGRRETSYGVYLRGDGAGNFTYLPNWKTNLSIEGSVRALETVQTKEGEKLVVGINDAKPLLISIQND